MQRSSLVPSIKNLLSSAGLKPMVLRLYNAYRAVIYGFRSRFEAELHGKRVVFITQDAHSKRFFHYRYRAGELHEPPVSHELVSRLAGAEVFADVGAHLGYYTCLAGAAYPDLKLFVFEMNHNLVELIERNLKANQIDTAEVINNAVADRAKTIGYEADSLSAGLSMHQPGEGSGEVTAKAVSLDDVFASRGVMPDVIKIDVQGAELEVLKGAERILRTHRPVLFLEVHPAILPDFGTSPTEIYRYLTSLGYGELHMISEHRSDTGRLLKLDIEKAPPPHTHMLVCAGSRHAEGEPHRRQVIA